MTTRLVAKHFMVPDTLPELAVFLTGVYMLYHISDPSSQYVGCATIETKEGSRSKNGFFGRYSGHRTLLHRGKHYCKGLQAIVNNYGMEGLRMEIVEIAYGRNECLALERFYINTLPYPLNSMCPYSDSIPQKRVSLPITLPSHLRLFSHFLMLLQRTGNQRCEFKDPAIAPAFFQVNRLTG